MIYYKVENYIRVKYFKTKNGAIKYAKKFHTVYKEVIIPDEIQWAKKQLKIKEG